MIYPAVTLVKGVMKHPPAVQHRLPIAWGKAILESVKNLCSMSTECNSHQRQNYISSVFINARTGSGWFGVAGVLLTPLFQAQKSFIILAIETE